MKAPSKKQNNNDKSGGSKLNKATPLSGSQKKGQKWVLLAIVSGFVAVVCLIVLLILVPRSNTFVSGVGDLRVLSQQLTKNVGQATNAAVFETSEVAFSGLQKDQAQFDETLQKIMAANTLGFNNLDGVNQTWASMNQDLSYIVKQKTKINELFQLNNKVNQTVPEVQAQYNEAVNLMTVSGSSTEQVLLAKNQVILAERILRSITALVSGNQGAVTEDFVGDTNEFGMILKGELQGNSNIGVVRVNSDKARARLKIIENVYENEFSPTVNEIAVRGQSIYDARQKAEQVSKSAATILKQLNSMNLNVASQPFILLPAFLLLLSFLIAIFALYRLAQARGRLDKVRNEAEAKRQRQQAQEETDRARKIQEENERNQMAILRLLDELGDLADGDLTVSATVSEDFTGAIADSVNFAIDQLRLLVSAINNTADNVARSTDDTQSVAMELAEATEHQAQEIAGASAAINQMAVSIDQVSANASESASVAQRSVAIAYNGAEVVQRSIEGMNTIRDQIQETAKRIKRLGESSQEIGEIVGLINDIADQTNILALNAAIQASMAGEAGRGFAVVADEVQRLAERSANATKQIETLVKTIQADTNEAVMSMEMTTSEVVKGARLAKDAGEALEEVQSVSNTLAELIQNISNAARQQAASAGHVSNTMNIIQDITSQTTSGTMAAARSVGQLNEMALALQDSVSGFKLPEDELA